MSKEYKQSIVHLGLSNFHRAHQCVYVNRLNLLESSNGQWTIKEVALRKSDFLVGQVLEQQNFSYGVLSRTASMESYEKIDCIESITYAYQDFENAVNLLSDDQVKFVTATVTEGGYYFNSDTKKLNSSAQDIQSDISSTSGACTLFGYLYQGLKRRSETVNSPITIISCDNVSGNGDILKSCLLDFVALVDEAFVEWIKANVTCPNTMVDRITPQLKPEDLAHVKTHHAEHDQAPIVCEEYLQWVIEDNGMAELKLLEEVGVEFVQSVETWEETKLKILNSGHSILGFLGYIKGHDFVHTAVLDAYCRDYMESYFKRYVYPSIPAVSEQELDKYAEMTILRFGNHNIADTLDRIRSDSINKFQNFLAPTINFAISQKIDLTGLVPLFSSFYVYDYSQTLEKPMQAILNGAIAFDRAYALSLLERIGINQAENIVDDVFNIGSLH